MATCFRAIHAPLSSQEGGKVSSAVLPSLRISAAVRGSSAFSLILQIYRYVAIGTEVPRHTLILGIKLLTHFGFIICEPVC